MPRQLRETTTGTITPTTSGLHIGVISTGWGSSGHYSEAVLRNAAADKVWPAGTHMFFDHPSESEQRDRPERSVRDLAAVLTEDARWDDDFRGLVANAKVVGPYADLINDPVWAENVGVSIRATGESTIGEADGRTGQLITRLDEGISVDFVTRAGRGGKILALLESARRPLDEASVEDTRTALQDTVTAAYGAETDGLYVWVRDFDPAASTVVFTIDSGDQAGTYQQVYTDNGRALAGDRVKGRMVTTFTPDTAPVSPNPPVTPAGLSTTTQESKEDTMPEISEVELTNLTEAAGRVPTLESERDTALLDAATARAELAVEKARRIIATANVAFTPLEERGLLTQVTVTDGVFDEAAFTTVVTEAAATKASDNGAGQVRGFGGAPQSTELTEADVESAVARIFGHKEA